MDSLNSLASGIIGLIFVVIIIGIAIAVIGAAGFILISPLPLFVIGGILMIGGQTFLGLMFWIGAAISLYFFELR